MGGAWQRQERLVADWLGTFRTPLSGRNNRNDDGTKRLGDVLYREAVIEIKRRSAVSMINVPCVRDLARAAGLPWVLYEFKTAYANAVKITVDLETAQYITECLDKRWREIAEQKKALHGGK